MKNIFVYILILINILPSGHLFCQDYNKIDSLNKLYSSSKSDTDKIVLLSKIAVHYWYNNPDTSISISRKGLTLAENIGFEKGKANCLHVLGYAYHIKGNYAVALDLNLKALKIREKINDKKGLERSFNNIGNIYLDKKDYTKAYIYYQKGLILAKDLKIVKDIALLSNNIGRMHYFKKEYHQSLEFYFSALEISIRNQFNFEQVISLLNIGRTYVELNDLLKAEEFLQKGLSLAKRTKNKEKISMAYTSLAEIEYKKMNYHVSNNFAKKALEAAREINSLQYMKEAAFQLFENYQKLGDYKNALYYHLISTNHKDSMFASEKNKEIENILHQFEIEKHQNEIEILEKDKKIAQQTVQNQKLFIAIFASGLLFLLMLAFVIFRSRQKERKANIHLRKQQIIISETNEELNQLNEEIKVQRDNLQDLNDALSAKNEEILKQKEEIELKNYNITASLFYAQRIQKAVVPKSKIIEAYFNEYFILFKPKDIVSGDFYFVKKINNHLIVAAADCTGHGVPGAFMSMLGIAFLNEIILREEITTAAQILNSLRHHIKISLHQTGKTGEQQDGMDIALCLINIENLIMHFSGANSPLWLIKNSVLKTSVDERLLSNNENNYNSLNYNPVQHMNKELVNHTFFVYNSDKMPIGVHPKDSQYFTNHMLQLENGDIFYIFSDGYNSQFGGEKGEKIKTARFQEIILNHAHKSMHEQKHALENEFENWKGNWEQVDDVLVIGVKI